MYIILIMSKEPNKNSEKPTIDKLSESEKNFHDDCLTIVDITAMLYKEDNTREAFEEFVKNEIRPVMMNLQDMVILEKYADREDDAVIDAELALGKKIKKKLNYFFDIHGDFLKQSYRHRTGRDIPFFLQYKGN